jgi:hypothetical protein
MEAQLHSDDMVRQFSILPENEGENYHKPEGQGKEIARKWSELRYTADIANLYQPLQYILLEVKKHFPNICNLMYASRACSRDGQ